jgi:predicted NAD/FAD-binding protein
VDRVISRDKKEVKVAIITKDGKEVVEKFDEMVLCCLADTSLKILGNTATWMEKRVLGSAKFSDDITVSH